MIKKVKIRTTYNSELNFDTVLHIDITLTQVKIVYWANEIIQEKTLSLLDIQDIHTDVMKKEKKKC